MSISGITEDDIATYLVNTPEFFDRHAALLASVQLVSPHSHRTVSLQERQMEMLRERIKGLERRMMEMMRHGQENMLLADRLHRWTRALMRTHNAFALPGVLVGVLRHEFMIPQAALRLWGIADEYFQLPCAQPVSDEMRVFTASLTQPFCGLNASFEAADWLEDGAAVQSLAMLPLRSGDAPDTSFGMLVLGSPDPTRYTEDMGVDFLVRIGELAGAAAARLLSDG